MLVFNVISNYVLAADVTSYLRQHLFLNPDPDYAGGAWLKVFYVLIGLFLAALEVLAVKNIPQESVRKLLGFSVAVILLVAIPNIIINLGIKSYVGRIRYRAMNMYPDNSTYGFAAFANWYEVNGQWLDDVQKASLFGNTDALKSFPSGHTCAAGMSYGLIMLNDALHIKDQKVRNLLWIIPILITGTVAVSRIIVGAHFFSDVLIGGTMSFLTMILVREIFVCKGANVKAMFGKAQKA
jgi:membrane-associated phospholipid phosphatase